MKRLIYCLALMSLCGCHKKEAAKLPPVPVTVIDIAPHTIPANYEYVGVAQSSHIVELRARVEGYLEKISYVEGGVVRKGDLMFVIDQRPFEAKLAQANGELARQEAILWNARESKDRMVPLYSENAVSKRDLDNALADEMAAQASVLTAQAEVQTAEINLDFTAIRAPVTGMSSRAIYREGALISPGPNSLLTQIYVIDPIWVNFSVSEGDLIQAREEIKRGLLVFPMRKDFQIEVVLADGSIVPATGDIDFTDPSLQQETGTMLVRSVLDNPQNILMPGQFVRVIVKGPYRPNAFIVPQTAVMQGQTGTFVYVVQDNKAVIQPVETGPWYKDDWVIFSGVKEGDLIIAEGVNRVQNGSEVTIVKKLGAS